MATDTTLLTLALELAADWDSSVDTTEGSPFRTKFLDPFLERVGPSILDADVEDFLVSRLETEIPGIDVSPLSGIRDLAVRPGKVMLEPIKREIKAIKLAGSLDNFAVLTKDEVNAQLANYFTEIQEGNKSIGNVRVYFPSPQSVVATPLTQFSTGGGLNFYPSTAQSVTATQMSFNQDGDLFYVDLSLQAENPGSQYDVDVGEIIQVSGLVGAVRVTNLAKFSTGLDEETKEEAIGRTKNSITIRNLITDRGVKFVLPENFPKVDTLQVIGYGDDEMQRDVISGPVAISDIPDGLTGTASPDVGGGQSVHIGGKTDIYVYQLVPNEDDLDISDVSDHGVRVYAGTHGFTQPGSATATFEDDYGFFVLRGVVAGDLLYLGEDIFEISVVASTELTVIAFSGGPSTIDAGLFEQIYDIVRRTDGQLTIPLYDLVAEDDDGNPVFSADDNPVQAVPGDSDKGQLVDGSSSPVEKDDNISRANIKLPLLRVTTVEKLDPLTLEATGLLVPMRDVVLAIALDTFTGGGVSTKATGTVRVYFRDAVSAWSKRASTTFLKGLVSFRPITEQLGSTQLTPSTASGTNTEDVIILTGSDFTADDLGVVKEGDRIEILTGGGAGIYTIIGGVFSAGNTEVTIRETLPATFSGIGWKVYPGVAEGTITQDTDLGLYYFDVSVEAVSNGVAGNIAADSILDDVNGLISEGWTLKTTKNAWTYSTRELPYIQLSEWVNDDFFIGDPLDAPAFRFSYEYAGDLQAIQVFCDDPDNRIVAEDVLVRHFLPSYVRANITERGLSTTDAKATLVTYINELDPTLDLEVSDLSDALYDEGATHFQHPVSIVGLAQDVDRYWLATISEDSLGSSRVQHFIADEDALLLTEETD